jgi:hypothetical protein
MRIILKKCEACDSEFRASCGAERFCSNDCMFDASYVVVGECWIWQRQLDKDGYGVMRLKGRGRDRAHRFSHKRFKGPIPPGQMGCHTCDTPACVNPEHLFSGTALRNKRDCMDKGRHLRGERHHKAKLKHDDVRAIRASDESGAALAARFGVTKENVYAIRKRQIWRDV